MPVALRQIRSALAGLSCLLLTACSGDDRPAVAAPAPMRVVVQQAVPRIVPVTAEFIGRTQSSRQVQIVSRVDGFLEQKLYEEGSFVQAGQPLYRIDNRPFTAQLQAARAMLAQQEAALTVARANHGRLRTLAARSAISQHDVDQSAGQEQQAAAQVESARASVVQAELHLGYTRIDSPVSGIAGASLMAEGSYITAANPLTHVAQLTPMWVVFSVTETQMLQTRQQTAQGQLHVPQRDQMPVELYLADGSLHPEQGRISFADAEYDTQTGSFLARATFANTAGTLRPGQFVKVRLTGASLPDAIVIPQRAVLQTARGHMVWVVGAGDKAEPRLVRVGRLIDNDWVIESGLHAGDRVVVEGGMLLRPGTPVQVTSSTAPTHAKS